MQTHTKLKTTPWRVGNFIVGFFATYETNEIPLQHREEYALYTVAKRGPSYQVAQELELRGLSCDGYLIPLSLGDYSFEKLLKIARYTKSDSLGSAALKIAATRK